MKTEKFYIMSVSEDQTDHDREALRDAQTRRKTIGAVAVFLVTFAVAIPFFL